MFDNHDCYDRIDVGWWSTRRCAYEAWLSVGFEEPYRSRFCIGRHHSGPSYLFPDARLLAQVLVGCISTCSPPGAEGLVTSLLPDRAIGPSLLLFPDLGGWACSPSAWHVWPSCRLRSRSCRRLSLKQDGKTPQSNVFYIHIHIIIHVGYLFSHL